MLSGEQRIRVSKLLAFLLRHDPSVPRDTGGWVRILEILKLIRDRYPAIRLEDLREIVEKDEKGRYEIDGELIRARYGHSVESVLDLPESNVRYLYHGTTLSAADRILREGLQPMGRQMVHLSTTPKDAAEVGRRKTRYPVVLRIDAEKARKKGIKILKASEKVCLASYIPPDCVEREEGA